MTTANEALFDALVRHQTYLMRFSGSVRNRMLAILDATEDSLAMLIRDRLRAGTGLNSSEAVARMEKLIDSIDSVRSDAWKKAADDLQQQMIDLAIKEPALFQSILATVSPVVLETTLPSARLLRAIVMTRPFQGRVLREWAQTMEAEDLRRIHSAVQMGMVAGESSAAIARRVIGTGELKGADGITELTRRQVTAITRTSTQHVANSARSEFLRDNADIVTEEQFVATLDSRTTPVCKANDGKRFPLDSGPRPPLHWQCRSLRIPALNGEMLGMRPAKASTQQQLLREFSEENKLTGIKKRDDIPRGMKGSFDSFSRKRIRELTGRVPASTSYQQWLERQSRAFQEDTLGKTRAKLFREGKLPLDKFVAADGSELTLAQLAVKQKEAFRAAGLNPDDFT
jgi:SPP1 gp7 family putative phage head morphogenesis protein